jgi:outer membrane protein TolC
MRLVRQRGLVCALFAGAAAVAACAVAVAHAQAAADTAVDAGMRNYVDEVLRSNDALHAETLAWNESLRVLDEARLRYYPTLTFNARYTVATGGRTIEVPVGDLLNPVYRTLNSQVIHSAQFPQIDNQTIDLVRPREQDTRLSMTMPVYAPQLDANLASKHALADVEAAKREALARTLVRDTQRAWCAAARAQSLIGIFESSVALLAENTRVDRALFATGKVTRDRVLRAQAEELAMRQQLGEGRSQLAQAKRYLNFLANRTEDAPVDLPTADATEAAVAMLALPASDIAVGVSANGGMGGEARSPWQLSASRRLGERAASTADAATAASVGGADLPTAPESGVAFFTLTDRLGGRASGKANTEPSAAASVNAVSAARPEIKQIDSAIVAAQAGADAAHAEYLPQLVFAGDYGYQQDHYRFAADSDIGTASLVASWTLFDFGQRRARLAGARLEKERLQAERSSLLRQLELARRAAGDDVATQRESLATARARLDAAKEAFRIAERKRNAGSLSEVEFLDAERTLTEARMGLSVAYYGLLSARAELDYAMAAYPLPQGLTAAGSSLSGAVVE